MADLFYNLAESALGVANAVRPMLAPRYGPPPAIGGDGAPVAPAFAREVAAEVSAPLAPLIPDGETRAGASLATFRQMAHALPTAPDELPDAGDTIAPDGGEPRTPGEEQLAEVAGDASAQMTLATLPERTGGPAAAIAHDGVADVQRKAVEGSMFSAPVSPPA
ncbi:MAG TPA: hypothetical protein VF897_18645, partial [Roseiflexaceae bacterium]